VGQWVAFQNKGAFSVDTATALGLQKESGDIVAGVIYENWNGRSIIAQMAIRGMLTRKFLGAVFRYPYVQLGVEKVILIVATGNDKSNRFARHLGFTEECRVRDADPSGDLVIYTLKKSDCRFLGEAYG
jgi:RimJ/RimL family protein N-acetyltransferase